MEFDEDLDSAFTTVMKNCVETIFMEEGEVGALIIGMPPKATSVNPDKTWVFIDVTEKMDDKDSVADLISEVRERIPRSVFITEAWIAIGVQKKGQTQADMMKELMSQKDNRKEAVLMHVYTGLKARVFYAEIVRPEYGSAFLGSWDEMGGKELGGRFVRPPVSWN